jgi:ankyrin repeat protein
MTTKEGTQPDTKPAAQPTARWLGPLALYLYGSAVAFWLWAKWLFAPQMFVLPPLPPVEVLILLVQNTLGPWIVALLTISSLGLIGLDAWRARPSPGWNWWGKSILRGSVETVLIHLAVWAAGTILFFSIMALLPGSRVESLASSDPVVRGLLLFTAFLSLLMAGPITALVIAARCLARARRDGFPPTLLATLNHAVAILLVPLAALWVLSGYPREMMQSLSAPPPAVKSEALLAAAREGDTSRVKFLLRQGAAVNVQDRNGMTPLHAAAANGHADIVRELLEAKANPNLKDSGGRTALMAAAANRQEAIVSALIAARADVQARDAEGKTALMLAARTGNAATVRALLAAGAEVNAAPASGETALISACRRGSLEIVRALLEGGADASATNKDGQTALAVARRNKHQEVMELLEAHAKK